MNENDPDIFTRERIQEEQEWHQKRVQAPAEQREPADALPDNPLEALLEQQPGSRDSEARERISQYEVLIPELESRLTDIDARMAQMRDEGIPNPGEYDALREQLGEAYEPLSALRQDMTAIDEGAWDVSPGIRKQAHDTLSEVKQYFERIEDIYKRSDAWLHEHQAEVENYGRRSTDYGRFKERLLDADLYDEQVVNLMHYTQKRIEWAADKLIAAKRMEEADARELLAETDKVHEQLLKLDERTQAPQESRERKSLISMLDRLRARLGEYLLPELGTEEEDPFAFSLETQPPLPPEVPSVNADDVTGGFAARETPKPGSLAAARTVHRQVRAQYAAVQHRLPEDHRRVAREKLARLRDMVRKAEHEEWERLFGKQEPREAGESASPESEAAGIEADVQLVMARAATAAPAIATAVTAVPTAQPKGVLAALGGAFRLK